MVLATAATGAPAPATTGSTVPSGIVTVGGDYSYAPFEFLNKKGRPTGFNVDLMRAIARHEHFRVRFDLGPWNPREQALEHDRRIDVMAMFRSRRRESLVHYSAPFMLVYHAIFARQSETAAHGLPDLAGKRVLLERGAYADHYLSRHEPDAREIHVVSEGALLRLLAAGHGDYGIAGNRRAHYLMQVAGIHNLVSTSEPIMPVRYAFAVRRDEPKLLAAINRGLRWAHASGTYDRIYEHWFPAKGGLSPWVATLLRILAVVAGVLVLAALAALAWVRLLRRTVSARTRELSAELERRLAAEASLARSEAAFRAAFEHAGVGIASVSAGGVILRANRMLGYLLAIPPDALAGRHCLRYFGVEARRTVLRLAGETLRGERSQFSTDLDYRGSREELARARLVVTLIRDDAGRPDVFVAVAEDVSYQSALSAALTYQSTHDMLTGLLNRAAFVDSLRRAMRAAPGRRGPASFLMLDVEGFSRLNETLGHKAGDVCLQRIGHALRRLLESGELAGRLGADQFGCLLYGDRDAMRARIDALHRRVQLAGFEWEGTSYSYRIDIGVVPLEGGGELSDVLCAGEAACGAARQGGARIRFHAPGPRDGYRSKATRLDTLLGAIRENRVCFAYQPIVPADDPDPYAARDFEVFARIVGRDRSLEFARDFVPFCERYCVSHRLDLAVLGQVCRWIRLYRSRRAVMPRVSVNISVQSLLEPGFLGQVRRLLDEMQVLPEALCFEIAERPAVAHLSRVVSALETVKGWGSRIALDNFGVGMTSFAQVRELPVDMLKVDGLFVSHALSDEVDLTIVRLAGEFARATGRPAVAKYVETPELLDAMTKLGIDYLQGHAIARPRLFPEIALATDGRGPGR